MGYRVTWRFVNADGTFTETTELHEGLDFSLAQDRTDDRLIATLEVFATDVGPGPDWQPEAEGFERIYTVAWSWLR